jgi:hypothetical protein
MVTASNAARMPAASSARRPAWIVAASPALSTTLV